MTKVSPSRHQAFPLLNYFYQEEVMVMDQRNIEQKGTDLKTNFYRASASHLKSFFNYNAFNSDEEYEEGNDLYPVRVKNRWSKFEKKLFKKFGNLPAKFRYPVLSPRSR